MPFSHRARSADTASPAAPLPLHRVIRPAAWCNRRRRRDAPPPQPPPRMLKVAGSEVGRASMPRCRGGPLIHSLWVHQCCSGGKVRRSSDVDRRLKRWLGATRSRFNIVGDCGIMPSTIWSCSM
ncbi:hypothetical protein E2562_022562 [Oryza meyeriana var. granulata]|uniref:Uncharacterized protein n=1 Tax=Oryza meyeriana var. granulata TaxID=110450 RepID=A0A6G1CHT2_9ORYZ|nr:hypothetical protein E2562_022562 [Oryza meyeriana var. granulata]KAF0899684.1 hypothetical protein E2562_022562 [Oryza meyeriana var. granulata]KAF0899685.1 hypothetical protein E2562_022562 [Oryza meyeriana var. granulata]KAF0899686.1 hypothetical protein E2562_022562 [Oryza meyeriana var. granulata]KAF0899687.1 hypothetical protein E2562_022562 [Oryza meyeriana var. granulata]